MNVVRPRTRRWLLAPAVAWVPSELTPGALDLAAVARALATTEAHAALRLTGTGIRVLGGPGDAAPLEARAAAVRSAGVPCIVAELDGGHRARRIVGLRPGPGGLEAIGDDERVVVVLAQSARWLGVLQGVPHPSSLVVGALDAAVSDTATLDLLDPHGAHLRIELSRFRWRGLPGGEALVFEPLARRFSALVGVLSAQVELHLDLESPSNFARPWPEGADRAQYPRYVHACWAAGLLRGRPAPELRAPDPLEAAAPRRADPASLHVLRRHPVDADRPAGLRELSGAWSWTREHSTPTFAVCAVALLLGGAAVGAVTGALVLVGSGAFVVGGRALWTARHLSRARRVDGAAPAPGFVRVEGHAEGLAGLVAPYTGTPCAAYSVHVERHGSFTPEAPPAWLRFVARLKLRSLGPGEGPISTHTPLLSGDSGDLLFCVRGTSGEYVVDPRGATWVGRTTTVHEGNDTRGGMHRIVETLLPTGARIAVYGTLESADVAPSVEDALRVECARAARRANVELLPEALEAEVDAEVRRLRALPRVRLGRDRTLRIEVHETPSDLGPTTLRRRGLQVVGAGLAALAVAAGRAFA
ncbi:MAG: hypothetical protein ACOYM9_05385 [Bradymonadia bacterium]